MRPVQTQVIVLSTPLGTRLIMPSKDFRGAVKLLLQNQMPDPTPELKCVEEIMGFTAHLLKENLHSQFYDWVPTGKGS